MHGRLCQRAPGCLHANRASVPRHHRAGWRWTVQFNRLILYAILLLPGFIQASTIGAGEGCGRRRSARPWEGQPDPAPTRAPADHTPGLTPGPRPLLPRSPAHDCTAPPGAHPAPAPSPFSRCAFPLSPPPPLLVDDCLLLLVQACCAQRPVWAKGTQGQSAGTAVPPHVACCAADAACVGLYGPAQVPASLVGEQLGVRDQAPQLRSTPPPCRVQHTTNTACTRTWGGRSPTAG